MESIFLGRLIRMNFLYNPPPSKTKFQLVDLNKTSGGKPEISHDEPIHSEEDSTLFRVMICGKSSEYD